MEIKDDCSLGESVCQTNTPNVGGTMTPRYLVMHFTAGYAGADFIEAFMHRHAPAVMPRGAVAAGDGKTQERAGAPSIAPNSEALG